MLRRFTLLCALMCVVLGAPFAPTPCPESCECITQQSGHFDARCTTLDFLEKLQPKQVNALVSLDLSNQNFTKLHTKLKKLRNLKTVNLSNNNINDITELSFLPKLTYLNLKSNHIKYFTAASLPKNLIRLDISKNYLTHIPQDLKTLANLKEVNLAENPISCTCDTLKVRDLILSAGISLVKPVICHSPEKLAGQLLQSVPCTKHNDDISDQMQGDEPVEEPIEGSGEEPEELPTNPIFDNDHNNTHYTGIEEEFLIPQTTSPTKDATEEDDNSYEGSGDIFGTTTTEEPEEDYDFGSGDEENITEVPLFPSNIKPEDRPPACHFDCSTPIPFVPEEGSEEPDLLRKVFGLFTDEETPEVTTQEPVEEIVETPIVPLVVNKVDAAPPSNIPDENEKIQEAMNVEEIEKSSMNRNLIIVVALIALMICLIGYSIIRKRRSKRQRPQPIGQEMKTLTPKPTNGASDIPEKVPLMNGQNGNMNGKQVEEPVTHKRKEDLDAKDETDRPKSREEDSLLPEAHRVTIQAKELTTPKTPLLITRLRSDDGQFIATQNTDSS